MEDVVGPNWNKEVTVKGTIKGKYYHLEEIEKPS